MKLNAGGIEHADVANAKSSCANVCWETPIN